MDIQISEKAANHIQQLRQKANLNDNYALRVSVVGGGCSGLSYQLDFDDESLPGDQLFEYLGVKLVCNIKSYLYLAGTTLEFSDGLNGKGFHFVNPNASRTCGCGDSFSV
ncbi:MAG: iron-sulfur cluster assembly accessory protein [Bacteroidia bacterium]|nr:iron-sulfur cluster assembly accessory protein [Bacteroidia bacterium]